MSSPAHKNHTAKTKAAEHLLIQQKRKQLQNLLAEAEKKVAAAEAEKKVAKQATTAQEDQAASASCASNPDAQEEPAVPPAKPVDPPDEKPGNTTVHKFGNQKHSRKCRHDKHCKKHGCSYDHPPGRVQDCPDGDNCDQWTNCTKLHPRRNCHHGDEGCKKHGCLYRHPPDRGPDCEIGGKCARYGCTYRHPKTRKGDCRFGANCTRTDCWFQHPEV